MSRNTHLAACLAAFLIPVGLAAPTSAATLTPVSYTFDAATDCGTWCYHDAGQELIDGVVVPAGWAINAGAGWVGWRDSLVNIDFSFGGARTFNTVSVGATQDNPRDVVLPTLNIFSSLNGLNWTFQGSQVTPPSEANNDDSLSPAPHGFLTVAGLNFTAPLVRVQAVNNGPFVFIDEVRFTGSVPGAVPEPAAWALMLLGFGTAGAMLRRSRRLTA